MAGGHILLAPYLPAGYRRRGGGRVGRDDRDI